MTVSESGFNLMGLATRLGSGASPASASAIRLTRNASMSAESRDLREQLETTSSQSPSVTRKSGGGGNKASIPACS